MSATPQPPAAVLAYDQLHRLGRRGVWRAVLGVFLAALLVFVVSPVLWQGVFALGYAVAGEPVADSLLRLLDVGDPTPAGLAYINLTLATAIPVVWFLTRWLHGLHVGWVSSVFRRLRWKYLLACTGASVVALLATLLVGSLLPLDTPETAAAGFNEFTATTRDFLLVIVLLTPLQAAAEEYLFRGYLLQAVGGVVNARAFAVVGSALLFALAHGLGQSWPVFIDRLAFGLVSGVLVVLTGGLEAGIAMHVLNNVFAFGIALAVGDMASTLNPTGGTWWSLPTTLTQSLVYLALAVWIARRMGVAASVRGPVLDPAQGPV